MSAEQQYRWLKKALDDGCTVQFRVIGQDRWVDWHKSLQEPSLGYALCEWRIKP